MHGVTFHVQPIHPQVIMTPWILWPVTSSLHPLQLENIVTFHVPLASTTTTECWDLSRPAFIHYHYWMLGLFTSSFHPLPVPVLNNETFTSILHPLPLLNVETFHIRPSSAATTECCDFSRAACIHYHYRMLWPFTSIFHPLPLPNVVTFHIQPPSSTTTERWDLSHPSSIHYHYRMLRPFSSILHPLPLPNVVTFYVQLAFTQILRCG